MYLHIYIYIHVYKRSVSVCVCRRLFGFLGASSSTSHLHRHSTTTFDSRPETIYYIHASKGDGYTVAVNECVCVKHKQEIAEIPHLNGTHGTGSGARWQRKVQIKPHSRENFVWPKRKTSIITKHYTPPFEFGFFSFLILTPFVCPENTAAAFCYYFFFHPVQDVFAVGHEVIFSLAWQRTHEFPMGRMIAVCMLIYIYV